MLWLRLSLCALLLALAGCSPAPPSGAVDTSIPPAATGAPQSTAALSSTPAAASALTPTATPTARPTAPPAPPSPTATAAPDDLAIYSPPPPAFGYPIGWPDRQPGDGFFIRHGFQTENTWYNPGDWHTGEDWYALDGRETAGAQVYAIADGTVAYAGSNYPGRVVIVRHPDGLLSMYGHLDPALAVAEGQAVARGQLLGAVLRRADDVPNHLHFELRSFLMADPVNGPAPRYGYQCGATCPPGPGYWPISAQELPSALGWTNPTHTINGRAYAGRETLPIGEVVVATPPVSPSIQLWSAVPGSSAAARPLRELTLSPGERYALLAVAAGPEQPSATGASSYQLWYWIALPDEQTGWVQAAVALPFDTGSDGRPSSVSFNLLPAITSTP